MKENLKDILSNLNPEIDQETLLQYLQGQLSHQEQHDVEKKALDDAFETDALEGLGQIQNKQQLQLLVDSLNADLKKKTAKKKELKEKRQVHVEPWLLFTVIIILLLVIISFFIILRMQK